MRRALITVATSVPAACLLSVVLAVALAAPAAANSAGAASSNYLTRLRAIEPRFPGVEIAVIEAGNRLRLVNRSAVDVIVLGYEDESYLRVGPSGVYENRRSPATYLSRDRQAATPVPEHADPAAPAEWRRVSSARDWRWYDHRVHWMGAIDPPAVRREPGQRHVIIPEWTVGFRHGDTPFGVMGELLWVPPPSPLPWLLLALLPVGVATVLVGAALWVGSRSWWARPLAAAVALLVVVSAAAVLGRAFEGERLGAGLSRVVASRPLVVLAWLTGGAAIVLLRRGTRAGLYAAIASAVGVGLFGGVPDLSDLFRSQVPSVLPTGLARAAVAWTLGLGLAVLGCSLAAWRRAPKPAGESAH
ncbi:MAG: hypothetical protein LC799_20735 [Actinobacteria bacterium]|nr:hypothetical protein [Actinomycetota bacterium]